MITPQPPLVSQWFVYIVVCSDGTFYCGTTPNIGERISRHNTGKGAKYTRSRTPVKLMYSEAFPDRSTACQRESAIKKLNRQAKEELIKNATSSSSTSQWL